MSKKSSRVDVVGDLRIAGGGPARGLEDAIAALYGLDELAYVYKGRAQQHPAPMQPRRCIGAGYLKRRGGRAQHQPLACWLAQNLPRTSATEPHTPVSTAEARWTGVSFLATNRWTPARLNCSLRSRRLPRLQLCFCAAKPALAVLHKSMLSAPRANWATPTSTLLSLIASASSRKAACYVIAKPA